MCEGELQRLLLAVQMEVEAGLPLADRVYCPKSTCSALFVLPDNRGNKADSSAVCAACDYVFCTLYAPTFRT